MTVATVMPFIPAQWFTSAGDAVLSGGQLWFYEVGTSTPKAVYADYEAITPLSNPVILNAAGKATIFLGAGGYKVVLTDEFGAQIGSPVDGVFGNVGAMAGGTVQTGVATFADLRDLPNPGEVVTVIVSGALAQGDGGGGVFTFDPGISTVDDGGIVIAPTFGVGRWVRSVSGNPSISWWGIKGLTTESDDIAIANAFAYCNAQNCSLIIDRHNVGLRADATFSGSRLIFSGGDFYTAGAPANITMSEGATVEADPHDQLISGGGVIFYGNGQEFSPEWTSSSLTNAGLAIAIACAGSSLCRMVVSSPYACASSVAIPANVELQRSESGRLNFTAAASLSVGKMGYLGREQFFSWNSIANVGTVSINAPEIYPEWFGAVGDGMEDDSIAFYAAAKTGRVSLASAGNYRLRTLWGSTPSPLAIKGGTVTLESGKDLGSGFLSLESTKIVKSPGNWFAGTFLQALNSEFPVAYTATTQSITGCKYTGGALMPVFDGAPLIKNGHLDILAAQLLGTGADGKIQEASGDLELSQIAVDGVSFNASQTALTGGVALSNPMQMIYLVGNVVGPAVTITLPSMVGTTHEDGPNIIFFLALGARSYTVQWTRFGTPESVTHSGSMMLYCYRAADNWFVLKGAA